MVKIFPILQAYFFHDLDGGKVSDGGHGDQFRDLDLSGIVQAGGGSFGAKTLVPPGLTDAVAQVYGRGEVSFKGFPSQAYGTQKRFAF